MNRQWAQIIIGATALTGAFFFGSVMQRRHGDLDKRATPQPMLENEDLVWQTPAVSPKGILADSREQTASDHQTATEPNTPSAAGVSHPEPMVASGTGQTESAAPSEATPSVPGAGSLSDKSERELEQAGAPPSRKVVQPDFSRWSQNQSSQSPTDDTSGRIGQAAPLLPLGETPPLLEQPKQPAGQVAQLPPRTFESASPMGVPAIGTTPTGRAGEPPIDPWTAPLSSVLLKPATDSVRSTASQPEATSGGMLPVEDPASTPLLPPAGNSAQKTASSSLVAVNQPLSRKVELDTDAFRIHVVRTGDTLQSLAQKYYGKADFYLDIYLANQDQLSSPINLPVGKALKIPDYSR